MQYVIGISILILFTWLFIIADTKDKKIKGVKK